MADHDGDSFILPHLAAASPKAAVVARRFAAPALTAWLSSPSKIPSPIPSASSAFASVCRPGRGQLQLEGLTPLDARLRLASVASSRYLAVRAAAPRLLHMWGSKCCGRLHVLHCACRLRGNGCMDGGCQLRDWVCRRPRRWLFCAVTPCQALTDDCCDDCQRLTATSLRLCASAGKL